MMSERKPLTDTILLCGEGDNGRFQRTFTIVREVGRGASSISYEAFYKNSGRGILKEFYPLDRQERFRGLTRDAAGQLTAELLSTRRSLQEAQERYLAPYRMMLEARSAGDDVLGTFIPAFELYYGCDGQSNIIGSVYVWTPEQELYTFDKVCAEIQANPETEPERKLYRALNAVLSLTDCICALHRAELIHRDIKPSNFGFAVRNGELLTQSLTMFDINSICSVYDTPEESLGTEGFAPPELAYAHPDNRADIYSIGATLFCAVVVNDEITAAGGEYRDEYYERLNELVDTSRLIQASEGCSHPRLRNMLATILRGCLAPEREDRYTACETLRKDLERAIRYLLPGRFSSELLPGEKLVLVSDVEQSLDRNREKNSRLTFQYLLYQYPLYHWSQPEEAAVRVLVVGFGGYGQKFLDVCLQAGQMKGKQLQVTVLSGDETDKGLYLQERPGLTEFFDVDGPAREDSYGQITFRTAELSKTDSEGNRNVLCASAFCGPAPHYVFIALGDDGLNASTAAAVKTLNDGCFVSYVREEADGADVPGTVPVSVNENAEDSPLFKEIERMAFNTHLVWEKGRNPDRKLVHANFRKPYNHDSCVASVLSIKYKLYGFGIDLDQCSPDEAAKAFHQLSMDRKRRGAKTELTWLEHRRWVVEKLCSGWTRLCDYQACMSGPAKDERNKQHVCLVKSRPGPSLATLFPEPGKRTKWNTASGAELDALDDLDRMSVELHQAYRQKAKQVKSGGILTNGTLAAIRSMVENDRQAFRAFCEWHSCVEDIHNEDEGKTRQYQSLRNAFWNALDGLPESVRKAVRRQIDAFDTMFYPVRASMEYRDYKQDDVNIINSIPFILTYSESFSLVIPFATGNNTEVFGNVASVTVVNPAKIYYLCCLNSEKDVRPLETALSYVTGYLERKLLNGEVELAVACLASENAKWLAGLEQKLKEAGGKRVKSVRLLSADSPEKIPDAFRRYLAARRLLKRSCAEVNDTKLSHLLMGAKFYQNLRHYRFDPISQKFHSMVDCGQFAYLRKDHSISVADLAAFQKSSGGSQNQPEFFEDYKLLRKFYEKDSLAWKRACNLLAEYALQQDEIAVFETNTPFGQEPNPPEVYRYILSPDCRGEAAKLIEMLVEHQAIEPDSRIRDGFTGACELLVRDKKGNKAAFDRLFSNPYALLRSDAIQSYQKKGKIHVTFDDLVVRGLDIRDYPDYSRAFDRICTVLQFWATCGYVIGLSIEDGVIGFSYATRPIKKLLTTAGRILEIYVYHKAKETGRFDDVVSGFELDWAQEDIKNEFDCVLTKGFRSLFVECKARPVIDQDYYFKLSSLAKRFGIHATAVLIADTQEKEWEDNSALNRMQRQRGSMLDVVTIWKPIEIGNIGYTLLNIMDGTYQEEI